jgi:hypothetical protein
MAKRCIECLKRDVAQLKKKIFFRRLEYILEETGLDILGFALKFLLVGVAICLAFFAGAKFNSGALSFVQLKFLLLTSGLLGIFSTIVERTRRTYKEWEADIRKEMGVE